MADAVSGLSCPVEQTKRPQDGRAQQAWRREEGNPPFQGPENVYKFGGKCLMQFFTWLHFYNSFSASQRPHLDQMQHLGAAEQQTFSMNELLP